MPDSIIIKGPKNTIEVFSNRLTLTKEDEGLSQDIPFSSITAIRFSTAISLMKGYIYFSVLGGNEATNGILSVASFDDNKFIFDTSMNQEALNLKEYIRERIGRSPIDELIKLEDLRKSSVISKSEFLQLKKAIIGS